MHVIRKGETAAQVARANSLSLDELAALNPGKSLSRLAIGTRLNIRSSRSLAQATPRSEDANAAPRPPLSALPGAPVVVSTPMPHLERLLPYQVRSPHPADGPISAAHLDSHQAPSTTAQLLARMQPVMPPVTEAELKALLPTYAPADPDRLDLLWPVETRTISSAWGPRMRTKTVRVKDQRKKRVRYKGRHRGVDLTAPIGTAVFAALDGQVVLSGKHKQYGNYVVIEHGNGVATLYAHHRLNLVQAGEIVRRGQKIAEVGRTGNSTGPHLHFELKIDGVHRNPLPVLNDEEEIPAELAAQNALLGTNPHH
ncbi:MAG: peptidoglycan DD-metalloendopeptidase family protein [Geothrix sp.]|uniref:LysM peptidoglycan-binding domain-containing M23 family metallopeptidase n=1 Tax=Geothrix sp. TaxID=1962974 RepID=UPI0017DEDEF9|nr:M23 family metallopeptidase [Geothrix sp.]NWJ41509.1 peptidoglycan DD-metalloendopeptidase family protein [Geothrix sp.]WIL20506.1 MAG: peptidoglycan DD-metalloendopeptidase family protein [Geothrix sp.]